MTGPIHPLQLNEMAIPSFSLCFRCCAKSPPPRAIAANMASGQCIGFGCVTGPLHAMDRPCIVMQCCVYVARACVCASVAVCEIGFCLFTLAAQDTSFQGLAYEIKLGLNCG